MLKAGDLFPSFHLKAHDGSTVDSSDLSGNFYLIYFYPKADTPGCTKEACTLRDRWEDVIAEKLRVFGVSYDTPEKNGKFAEKYHLPFLLLSDEDQSLAKATGAKRTLLPLPKRISYLVGPDGKILKAYPSVDPAQHAGEVLEDLRKMRQNEGDE